MSYIVPYKYYDIYISSLLSVICNFVRYFYIQRQSISIWSNIFKNPFMLLKCKQIFLLLYHSILEQDVEENHFTSFYIFLFLIFLIYFSCVLVNSNVKTNEYSYRTTKYFRYSFLKINLRWMTRWWGLR